MIIIRLLIKLSCWKLMDNDEPILRRFRACPELRSTENPGRIAGFVPLGTRCRWRYTPDVHYVLITDGRGALPYSRELCMHTEGPTIRMHTLT